MTVPPWAGTDPPRRDEDRFRFTLYVSAASDFSRRAIVAAKAVCEAYVPGRYELSILDLEVNARAASADRILATPTLLKTHPSPRRRVVGDVSDLELVAAALGLAGPAETAGRDL
jgi:circadian clock protein KaiB